jgi:glucosyl-3-phosphoglycerate synthase
MISVIIPTLNEEKTIGKIVALAKSSPRVEEVIVVDDKSSDDTVELAKLAGASVITSTQIGKGASMMDGLLVANNEIVVYLDGDVEDYASDVVERMTEPIISGEADFVKSKFDREAGRVTELVAKPLLSLLFPQLTHFSQPLSGMIAGKRELLKKVTFENDYGVDIGIMLDVIQMGAKVVEVNLGTISHKMKQWHQLAPMSREVAQAILRRAPRLSANLDSLGTINIIRDQMEYAIKETLSHYKKMVVFDMDNTLLKGRFIDYASKKIGFEKKLVEIISRNQESYLITKLIARLFKGMDISYLLKIVDKIPLVPDAVDVVKELKSRGYVTGIISDSYDCIVRHIQVKVSADFSLANELEFSQSVATGELKIPSFFMRTEYSACNHNFCKSNALLQVAKQYGIPLANTIAVGDSEYDVCMVRMAGIGVAFCSAHPILNTIADQWIDIPSFRPLLEFAI